MQAGDLRDRVTFGQYSEADGTGGNFAAGPFEPQFSRSANVKPLNGGEEIMVGRLSGTRMILVTVRSDSDTRCVTQDWSAKLEATGELFSIVEAKDPDSKRHWVELLCRSGVAGGGLKGEQAQ